MTIEFESYLRSHANFNNDDLKRICSLAESRKLHRNDFLLLEGEICRHKTFIATGMVRVFGTRPDGSEHILLFSPEHTWTLDAESYDKQIPSRFNIAAVEESEILMWTKPDFDKLLADIPALKSFSEQLISWAIHNSRQRLLSALSATPEEKYNDFIRDSPALMKRLPLRMIAAYLGISLKTLTRIRHAQLHR
jgi:CRP/FNR family transcriptional regulator, anaerobic regulatory protein